MEQEGHCARLRVPSERDCVHGRLDGAAADVQWITDQRPEGQLVKRCSLSSSRVGRGQLMSYCLAKERPSNKVDVYCKRA